jgi:hypothetical protein
VIIRLVDCRECFYCSRGIRLFFDKYGLDYTDFIKNGIDADKLLSLNDSMANKVVEHASGKI